MKGNLEIRLEGIRDVHALLVWPAFEEPCFCAILCRGNGQIRLAEPPAPDVRNAQIPRISGANTLKKPHSLHPIAALLGPAFKVNEQRAKTVRNLFL